MSIHETAIIEDGAEISSGANIGPYCRVSNRAKLGDSVVLKSHVIVDGDTQIRDRTIVHPFAVLGGPPQHLGYRGEETKLVIGSDCIIREHVTINSGTAAGRGITEVGNGCFLMTGAHVAHDCAIGNNVIFANNATLGGHVVIGDHVFLGGLCAVHQFCRVGSFAFVGGCAAVPTDIIPYASASGNHAQLSGLNIIGMKRLGLPRSTIHNLRAAFRLIFAPEGTFAERVENASNTFAHSDEVNRIIEFIRADTRRPLMAPSRKIWLTGENSG